MVGEWMHSIQERYTLQRGIGSLMLAFQLDAHTAQDIVQWELRILQTLHLKVPKFFSQDTLNTHSTLCSWELVHSSQADIFSFHFCSSSLTHFLLQAAVLKFDCCVNSPILQALFALTQFMRAWLSLYGLNC